MILKIFTCFLIYSVVFISFEFIVFNGIFKGLDRIVPIFFQFVLMGIIVQISCIPLYMKNILPSFLAKKNLLIAISIVIFFVIIYYPFSFSLNSIKVDFYSIKVHFYHLCLMIGILIFGKKYIP